MTKLKLEEVLKIACEVERDICIYVNDHKDQARKVIGGDVIFFNPWVDKAHDRLITEICTAADYLRGRNREF